MTAHSLGSLSHVNSVGDVKAALLCAFVFDNNALSAGKCFCTSVHKLCAVLFIMCYSLVVVQTN